MTPGRGRPNSLGATISAMSPRFTSTHSSRMRLRSRHRWHRSRDGAPLASLVDGGLLEPSDRASPAPNAGRAAAPARGDARGTPPSAGAGCEVNWSGSSSGWLPCERRNMLRQYCNGSFAPKPEQSSGSPHERRYHCARAGNPLFIVCIREDGYLLNLAWMPARPAS